MLNHDVFHARLAVCRTCEFYRGACLKGHSLAGDPGCPLRKFAPANGAGYLPDLPVPTPELPAVSGTGCCGARPDGELKPMAWGEVVLHLAKSMRQWAASGFALADREVYVERIRLCKACPQYQWYQCKLCRCCVYSKAQMATETCPIKRW